MRCPDCGKFVGLDCESDPEISVDVSGVQVSGDCRITNNCVDCGTELKEATFTIDVDVPDFDEHARTCKKGTLSVESESEGRIDRFQDKTPKGETIKNVRFMKHLYGAEATFKVECDSCDFSRSIEWSDETPASGMEELV